MDAPPGSPKEDLAVLRELYEATNGYRWKVVWDLDQGWRDYVFHGVEVNDELRVCRIALRRNKLV